MVRIISSNSKGVSPVVATLLLIALVMAASGAVWLLTSTFLDNGTPKITVNEINFSDSNDDGLFDRSKFTIINRGLVKILPTAIIMQSDSGDVEWTLNNTIFINPGSGMEISFRSQDSQLKGDQSLIVTLYYLDDTENQYSIELSTSIYLPQLRNSSNIVSNKLEYREVDDDHNTFKKTFPGPGYSPTLSFILGKYSTKSIDDDLIFEDTKNYYDINYRPYLSDPTTFSLTDSSTNSKFIPYNDSGIYPGHIDFIGSNIDAQDTLGWTPVGLGYIGYYVYNPTPDVINAQIWYQVDDEGSLFMDGELILDQNERWNRWAGGSDIELDPGFTYFMLKALDRGGNFNAQIMFVDQSDKNLLQYVESAWPNDMSSLTTEVSYDSLSFRSKASYDTNIFDSNFPGSGYSPRNYYILGQFQSDWIVESDMYIDYISSAGFGNEETYRPYSNSTEVFSGNNLDMSTSQQFQTYTDEGNTIGLIDFTKQDTDPVDTLNWSSYGVVYLGFYINNPTETSIEITYHVQADDYFLSWYDGDLIEDHVNDNWDKWGKKNKLSISSGQHFFMLKIGDIGDNWNSNIIFQQSGSLSINQLTNPFV